MPNDSPDWGALTDVPPVLIGTINAPTGGGSVAAGRFNLPAVCTGIAVVCPGLPSAGSVQISGSNTGNAYAVVSVTAAGGGPICAPLQSGFEQQVIVDVFATYAPGPPGVLVAKVYALGASGYQLVQTPPLQPLQVSQQSIPAATSYDRRTFAAVAATAVVYHRLGAAITVLGYRFDGEPASAVAPCAGSWTLQGTPSGILIAKGAFNAPTQAGQCSRAYNAQLIQPQLLAGGDDVELVVTPAAGFQQYTGFVEVYWA